MVRKEGTPVHGDRGAWNVEDFDTEHASDIFDDILARHTPSQGGEAHIIVSDGSGWKSVALSGDLSIDKNGVVTIANTMIPDNIEPDAVTLDATNPPAEGLESGFRTHDYDPDTDESVYFHFEIPDGYKDAGIIRVRYTFFVDTAPASAENVVWGLEYKKLSEGDNFSFSSTTTIYSQEAVTTGTPANDKKIHVTLSLALVTTGFEARDTLLLRFFRDADGTGGTDDFTGDARALNYFVEVEKDTVGDPMVAGKALLEATASLGASAKVTHEASATLAATASLSAFATGSWYGKATLAASAAVAAVGEVTHDATATLAATATIAASGTVT